MLNVLRLRVVTSAAPALPNATSVEVVQCTRVPSGRKDRFSQKASLRTRRPRCAPKGPSGRGQCRAIRGKAVPF
eukprot:12050341-Alexandrium_andersonii.AAC.1